MRGPEDILLIAVERPDGHWITTTAPWPRRDARIVWALIIQTLVIYALILLPVLWIARRSPPLARWRMRRAASPRARAPAPLPVEGPGDVRDVVAAFNTLTARVSAMLEEKDRMLGAIGHDLRTPLGRAARADRMVEDDADRTRMAETWTR